MTKSATTDLDIRAALHAKRLWRVKAHPDTLVIDELGLAHAKSRIDVAVINGCIHCYATSDDWILPVIQDSGITAVVCNARPRFGASVNAIFQSKCIPRPRKRHEGSMAKYAASDNEIVRRVELEKEKFAGPQRFEVRCSACMKEILMRPYKLRILCSAGLISLVDRSGQIIPSSFPNCAMSSV